MSRFAITGMVLVLLMAIMIISLSGIDSQDKLTGFVSLGGKDDPSQAGNLPSTYSFVPISRISIDYSFSDYPKLVTEAKRLVMKCAGRENVTECLDIYLKRGWTIAGNGGNIYKFEVIGAQKLPQYDETESKIVEKELIYKLALDFS
jgi:hypothetical protein